MMTVRRKLNLSALPEQSDDYSEYEETGLRWDRISLLVLAVIAIIAVLSVLLSDDENKQVISSEVPVSAPVVEAASTVPEKQQKSVSPEVETPVLEEPRVLSPRTETEVYEVQEKQDLLDSQTSGDAVKTEDASQSIRPELPLQILDPGISGAQLRADLNGGQSIDIGVREVSMSGQAIIKVILLTEMNQLRGQTLYHDWYLKDVRQARVRIPVNVSPQHSSSSKYINQQMQGAWQIKVVDEQNKLYLLADFNVIGE